MGTMILAANASTAHKGSSGFTFVILAVLVVLFYVLIMRPQRKRQRAAAQTQSHVMPGTRIRTTAGMYGTVISGDDRDVVIEVAPGVQITMLRRAIMDVVPQDDGVTDDGMTDDQDMSAEHEHIDEPQRDSDEPPPGDVDPTSAVDLDKDRNN